MSARPLQKPKEMREADFAREVNGYTKYPKDLRDDFIGYWCEPNKSGTRMRFELEKTWSTGRRLGTWDRNNFGNKGKAPVIQMVKPAAPVNNLERLDRLLSIYSKNPSAYTISDVRKWSSEALNGCYEAIKEFKLWDPSITKADVDALRADETGLKATVIVRTLSYYGTRGFSFSDTLKVRSRI